MLGTPVYRAILIAIVVATLANPARANSIGTDAKLVVTGIVVVSAAVAVGVTVLVVHHREARRMLLRAALSRGQTRSA